VVVSGAAAREAERVLGRVDQALTAAPQFDGRVAFAGPRLPASHLKVLSRHAMKVSHP
jgi:hypothetical protein